MGYYRVWSCSPYGVCSADTEIKTFATTARPSETGSTGLYPGYQQTAQPTPTQQPTVTPTPAATPARQETENAVEVTTSEPLNANEERTMVLPEDAFTRTDVSSIAITTAAYTPTLTITIAKLDEKPADAPVVSGAITYLSITINNGSATQARVSFRVKKSEVGNNPAKSKIVLARLQGGKWVELPTTEVNYDDEYYYYKAVTPGFSYFVIKKASKPTATTTPTARPPQPTAPAASATPIAAASVTPATDYTWPIVIILAIAAVAAYVLTRPKPKDKKE